jgi:hypothetical protein
LVTQKCIRALASSKDGYAQLLAKYTALRETLDARPLVHEEKQDPEGRRPYVLLIDAHSHKVCAAFAYWCHLQRRIQIHDDYVSDGHEGGVNVAAILRWEVNECLIDIHHGDFLLRIVVRMMASFESLAGDFLPSKSTNMNNMRVLQVFERGFSADTWTDFVDVHHKAVVGRKIVIKYSWVMLTIVWLT